MKNDLRQIRDEKLNEIRQFCQSECDFTNKSDIQKHLAFMGRLALLGEMELLQNFQQELQKQNLWELTERLLNEKWLCCEQKWLNLWGKTLAEEIIFVQDMVGVLNYTSIPFSNYFKNCWNSLLDEVEGNTILDEQAFACVEDFFVYYPIPSENRLDALEQPFTSTMLLLMDNMPPFNPVNYPVKWNSRKNVWEIDAQEKGVFAVSWQNTPEKALFCVFPYSSDISGLTGIGVEPVIHSAKNPQNWIVPYRKNATDYLKEGFTLRFLDGSEATIPLNDSVPIIQTKILETRKQNVLKREHSLLAADSVLNFDYFMIIWQAEEIGTKFSGTFVNDTFRIRTNNPDFAEHISRIMFGGQELAHQNETSWTLPLQDILEFVKGDFSENWTLEIYMKDDPIPYILSSQEVEND